MKIRIIIICLSYLCTIISSNQVKFTNNNSSSEKKNLNKKGNKNLTFN